MSDNLPDGLDAFLATAGWRDAEIEPLAGDASFRRYFRIRSGDKAAMLMDAPPPNEDPRPFLRAAKWLDANGLRAPHVLAEDTARGPHVGRTDIEIAAGAATHLVEKGAHARLVA